MGTSDRHHYPPHKHVLNQSDKQRGGSSSPPRDAGEQKQISLAESEEGAETSRVRASDEINLEDDTWERNETRLLMVCVFF